MNYDIECKNDLLTGTTLIVKIPENEIDKKALYTIQTDMPPFIIPFHHYCIDGEALFVYNIGMFCKLQYMTGSRVTGEYAQLWISVLSPLLECTDWFMQPNAFLLDAEYLYYDKNKKSCCFVYIPTIKNISEHTQLKELAADISKYISVDDALLENKVLRAIMKDFDPDDLLQMLRLTMMKKEKHSTEEKVRAEPDMPGGDFSYDKAECVSAPGETTDIEPLMVGDNRNSKGSNNLSCDPNEIIIEIPEKGGNSNKVKSDDGDKKLLTKVKGFGGLFGKRKKSDQKRDSSVDHSIKQGGPLLFENSIEDALTTKKQDTSPRGFQSGDLQSMEEDLDLNWEAEDQLPHTNGVGLRCIGRAELPPFIEVDVKIGEIFSIGKFDVSVERQQSSFEFDKKIKGISCRHCAIKRLAEGYLLVDLASSAGTFVNNERLPPNTAYKLANGCRISIGNSGVEYVWEMVT